MSTRTISRQQRLIIAALAKTDPRTVDRHLGIGDCHSIIGRHVHRVADWVRSECPDERDLFSELISGEGKKEGISPALLRNTVSSSDRIQQVVDFYTKVWPARGKHLKQGHPDWKLIGKALELGYSVDDCKSAIIGNRDCEWHSEKRLHQISYIFRNAGKIEKFIDIAANGSPRELTHNERVVKRLIEKGEADDGTVPF